MINSKDKIITRLTALELTVENESEAAKSEAEQLLTLCEDINFKYGIAYSKLIISNTYWHLVLYSQGLKIAKEVLQLHQELEDDDLLPSILHTLALHSWGEAKLYTAQNYWIQALEQASLLGNYQIEIEALIGLGNVWRMTNNLAQANSTHYIAAQRANFYRIPHLEAKAYILQAWDNYLLHHHKEMLPILLKAEELLKDNTNLTWKAEIYDFRGLAFLGLNDLTSAQQCCLYSNQLAKQHNLIWMKAHSAICLARIETAKGNFTTAYELLTKAEILSEQFDKGELRSQICLEQSRVAELTNDDEQALYSYKRYRQYEITLLQEQSNNLGRDKSNTSKKQLDIRAIRLINRIKDQLEYNSLSSLTYLIPVDKWHQRLHDINTSSMSTQYHVVVIANSSKEKIRNITLLSHHYCKYGDALTRLNDTEIGLLLHAETNVCLEIIHSLSISLSTYPWHRYSNSTSVPEVNYFNIIEYLSESMAQEVL